MADGFLWLRASPEPGSGSTEPACLLKLLHTMGDAARATIATFPACAQDSTFIDLTNSTG
eukprot:6185394-Pleurochrysis_carterae.AAC.2